MTCASCGSSSGYADAAAQYDAIADLYDGYPGNYLEDILFFAEEAKHAGSPILEIGVGTGRLALCLAAAGLDVVGIDSSMAMLRALLRRQTDAPPQPGRVWVIAADMRTFAFRRRFRMAIVAFRTFLYLLTRADQRRALRTIRRHLLPGGRLAMSFFVPRPELLAQGRTRPREMARFLSPDGRRQVVALDWTEFAPARQRLISHITYEWRDEADRATRRLHHDLVARYVFPDEVPPLLESCGYRVVDAYGGFDRRPLGGSSQEQIWIAEPAKGVRAQHGREGQ
jgi:ubiquinone/menaquinone biosynthesis C-methylase UbiE